MHQPAIIPVSPSWRQTSNLTPSIALSPFLSRKLISQGKKASNTFSLAGLSHLVISTPQWKQKAVQTMGARWDVRVSMWRKVIIGLSVRKQHQEAPTDRDQPICLLRSAYTTRYFGKSFSHSLLLSWWRAARLPFLLLSTCTFTNSYFKFFLQVQFEWKLSDNCKARPHHFQGPRCLDNNH